MGLLRPGTRRVLAALSLAAGLAAGTAASADAFTLTLSFPDGKPMTYGSACAGHGCLDSGNRATPTDDRGQVVLPDSARVIEYRREGISLGEAPIGIASGSILAVGSAATVVLPRVLIGSAPEVDTAESDLVARLNEARAAQGLPRALISPKLSAAADYQATWLTQSGANAMDPERFHDGPFSSDLGFRHGEVSLPEADSGGEVAAAGATADEAVSDWLSSPPHRAQVLAPGPLLMGAARVGGFTIVETHRPCAGCDTAGTGTRASAPSPVPTVSPVAPPPPPPAPVAAPVTGSSAAAPRAGCGREQLVVRVLARRRGLVRLRVGARCLQRGARYVLLIRQGSSGRLLRTLAIRSAVQKTLRLRPSRTANQLRIKLKRDGRAIVARTIRLPRG